MPCDCVFLWTSDNLLAGLGVLFVGLRGRLEGHAVSLSVWSRVDFQQLTKSEELCGCVSVRLVWLVVLRLHCNWVRRVD